jgi:hypothetical protein
MFGCLGRLGCLVVILVIAGALYLTRDQWMSRVGLGGAPVATAPAGGAPTGATSAPAAEGAWEPVTEAAAARGRRAVTALGERGGPAYATVRPGDLAAYIFTELARQLPRSATDVQATARGDRLYVRSSVKLSDFGGAEILGPLAKILGERETMEFGGTLDVLRPGLAQFRVHEIKLRELKIPRPMIPRLIQQIRRGPPAEGVADDALPIEIPPYVGDVRVTNGRVLIYRSTA